jgi:hypothetical protein
MSVTVDRQPEPDSAPIVPFGRARAWLLGAICSMAILGPALRMRPLLSLDLVVPPRFPLPAGTWGLGPDLPRRVPLGIVVAWLSHLVGGPVSIVALLAVAIAAAFAGASRLAARWGAPMVFQPVAGAVMGLSPFLLTRVGAGQWGLVAAVGILPWALPHLLEPRDAGRVLLWSTALGFTGFAGGVFALMIVVVGLLAVRLRGAWRVLGAVLVGQLPWLVPGVIVAISAGRVATSAGFRTDLHGPLGVAALLAGQGFWRASSQLGLGGGWAAAIGLLFLVLAVIGACELRPELRARVAAVALLGLVITMASSVPGVRGAYDPLAATSAGAPLREGQRTLALTLMLMAPLVALGVGRVARGLDRTRARAAAAGVALVAIALAWPGLWGLGGRLKPRAFPPSYAQARHRISAAPGPVLALPWHEYLDLGYAGGRRVLNPLSDYLGGDVIVSSDPEVPGSAQESADRRAAVFGRADRRLRPGQPLGDVVEKLGVRWVVLLEEVDWHRYGALDLDPRLAPVDVGTGLRLYGVRAWKGPVVTDAGRALPIGGPAQPLGFLASSGPAIWSRSGQPGWMRGLKAAKVTKAGTLVLPAGSGPIWYWPAALVLLADAVTLAAVVRTMRSLSSHERSVTVA